MASLIISSATCLSKSSSVTVGGRLDPTWALTRPETTEERDEPPGATAEVGVDPRGVDMVRCQAKKG